jgi:EAL domain-containing protein (putative c-di-GMP-specific phosphodiesterase class I)/GGDEF domain-containing protein
MERLARALHRYSHYGNLPFAVLLLGLDRSAAGESASKAGLDSALLNAIARRLETCLRTREEIHGAGHDHLVARLEDDNFAVLLESLHEIHSSKRVAEHLVAELQAPVTIGARHVYLSPVIGIAVSVTGYTSADAMLRDAETALHRARVLGGSRSEVFDTGMLHAEQAALRLEHDLLGALDRGEFALAYQPIVSMASQQIVGFEALLRWHHPIAGLIAPADFVPTAERTGFIVPLGAWVLRQACEQVKAWRAMSPATTDVWMSVNLSGVQVKHPSLVDEIGSLLRECQLDPRALVLELTEGIACDDLDTTKTVLMQLRALGIRISIDDFGTGYSSLSYLRQFPVDTLKIDRSFVSNITTSHENAAIVGTVTSMAKQLGLHVVAEGIEREDQAALLRAMDCHAGQGYLFARPLDPDAATEVLKNGGALAPLAETRLAPRAEASPGGVRRPRAGASRRWIPLAAAAGIVLTLAGVMKRVGGESYGQERRTPIGASAQSAASQDVVAGASVGRAAQTAVPVSRAEAAADVPPTSHQAPGAEENSFLVQHLHRLGSCSGRLVVSRKGLLFTPTDASSSDRVMLSRGDFLASTSDRTLTVQSSAKTYRFRFSKGTGTAQLRRLTAALSRIR